MVDPSHNNQVQSNAGRDGQKARPRTIGNLKIGAGRLTMNGPGFSITNTMQWIMQTLLPGRDGPGV